MITVPVNIPLPERMDLSGGNLPVKWRRFCRAWSNYEISAQIKDPENPSRKKEQQVATLEFENQDQRKDPEVIIEKTKQYCSGECNETYERYVFSHPDQESNESVAAYVTALRKLAKTCNYGSLRDSLIRDKMVVGIK